LKNENPVIVVEENSKKQEDDKSLNMDSLKEELHKI